MMLRIVILMLCLGLLVSACTPEVVSTATTTRLPTGVLTPFYTVTPSPIPPTARKIISIPVTPMPSATPFLHTITNDDTMLGIAYQYGISLEELQAANPGVDPHFLSVGKQLVIPISGEIPINMATPTPASVKWDQPQCYRSGDGGTWCIMEVRNNLESDVENLSAWIGLYNDQGENFAGKVAVSYLNLLQAGSSIPLMVYFDPPLPEKFGAQAELLSALVVNVDDNRYIDIQVNQSDVVILPDGRGAKISGEVLLANDAPVPLQVWILAIAYDQDGNIVGARKWEFTGDLRFEVTIYSLAGSIDHIELLSEARP